MKRWAWNLFCLFSLLVFVSSVTLWERSYLVRDQFETKTWGAGKEFSYNIESSHGRLEIYCDWDADDTIINAGGWGWVHHRFIPLPLQDLSASVPDMHNFRFLGFHLQYLRRTTGRVRIAYYSIGLPLWLFLPAAIPPILWLKRRRRRGGRGFPVAVTSGEKKEKFTTELTENTEGTERDSAADKRG